jgi:hypothetical protein
VSELPVAERRGMEFYLEHVSSIIYWDRQLQEFQKEDLLKKVAEYVTQIALQRAFRHYNRSEDLEEIQRLRKKYNPIIHYSPLPEVEEDLDPRFCPICGENMSIFEGTIEWKDYPDPVRSLRDTFDRVFGEESPLPLPEENFFKKGLYTHSN